MRASSRPETALFCNLGVRLRITLCDVHEYASAEILAFLDLAEKSLVSASGTALYPSGVSGWERAKSQTPHLTEALRLRDETW